MKELDFDNHIYWVIHLFDDKFRIFITTTTLGTWLVGALLLAFAVVVRVKLKKWDFDKPPQSGFQNVVELMIESFENFVKSTMGEKYAYFGNWFFGVIALIWGMNIIGLLGMRAPTANLVATFSFGISTFVLIHFMWIKTRKWGYFKDYVDPIPLFLPLNLIGELATPVSLSFRLFGNLLGGTIIMGLVYGLFPWFMKIGVPAALHAYFDIFGGSLQAFIFTILSMTFIKSKIAE